MYSTPDDDYLEYGKKGFPIPSMDRVNFIDPSITFLKVHVHNCRPTVI